ncbi:MAG TPA: pyridoxamine 5'-phosphate oxidase family protein [Acidobacteriota bacterium]|nr:pyridoxamine 5'-phosphate oxidase family protein [Acidobacteriota bacterium]
MRTLSDEQRAMLQARRYAILATHNHDGSIHLTPVWYLFENDTFYVGTSSQSRKARNLASQTDATIIVDVRKPGGEGWVYASGQVEIRTGEEAHKINSRIQRRYLTEAALEDPRTGPIFEASDDITLCLVPKTWRSWSTKEMDEQISKVSSVANPRNGSAQWRADSV